MKELLRVQVQRMRNWIVRMGYCGYATKRRIRSRAFPILKLALAGDVLYPGCVHPCAVDPVDPSGVELALTCISYRTLQLTTRDTEVTFECYYIIDRLLVAKTMGSILYY